MKWIYYIYLTLIFILSCSQNDNQESVVKKTPKSVDIEYAKGFHIFKNENGYLLQVTAAWKGNNKTYNYILSRKKIKHNGTSDTVYIHIPIEKAICSSTSDLGYIMALNEGKSIVGISQPNFIYNQVLYNKVKEGKIADIGNPQNFNLEKILNLQSDILFAFGINASSSKELNRVQKLTHHVVLIANYMEKQPLGKLEWIKFYAAFYDQLNRGTKYFNVHKENYLKIKKIAQSFDKKPTMFSGFPWKGTWSIPGGKSFQAHFFKDAGANYVWQNNKETSSVPFSVEHVIETAYNADFWLNLNRINNLNELEAKGKVFTTFKAFKTAEVYNNDKKKSQNGGYDYWESGVVNPDIILRDLVKIFHPEAFPNDSLYYYRKLK